LELKSQGSQSVQFGEPKRSAVEMKRIQSYSISILFLLGTSVSSSVLAKQDDDSASLKVSGKAVVFFGPSKKEYDLLPDDEKAEMDEVLSDFYFYSDKLMTYLKRHRIYSIMTSVKTIEIRLDNGSKTSYKRKDFDHAVGIIMTDGKQKPNVILGVDTDEDLLPELEKYFHMKLR